MGVVPGITSCEATAASHREASAIQTYAKMVLRGAEGNPAALH
jgi:hypothetical protein